MYSTLSIFFPFGFTGSSLLCGLSLVVVPGLLIVVASLVVEHRLSSCDTRALVNLSMWNLPGSGIEPISLASVSGLPIHCTTMEVLQCVDLICFSFAI